MEKVTIDLFDIISIKRLVFIKSYDLDPNTVILPFCFKDVIHKEFGINATLIMGMEVMWTMLHPSENVIQVLNIVK